MTIKEYFYQKNKDTEGHFIIGLCDNLIKNSINGIIPKFRFENGLWVEFDFSFLGEKVGENLSENQRQILDEIRRNPKISALKLSSIISISSRRIEENIKKLKVMEKLKRVGPAKGGSWEILE